MLIKVGEKNYHARKKKKKRTSIKNKASKILQSIKKKPKNKKNKNKKQKKKQKTKHI